MTTREPVGLSDKERRQLAGLFIGLISFQCGALAFGYFLPAGDDARTIAFVGTLVISVIGLAICLRVRKSESPLNDME